MSVDAEVEDEFGAEGDVCLQLQADLIFTPQSQGERGWSYRIDDLTRSRFFRIGVEEYSLISLFDGSSTLREAWRTLQQAGVGNNLTQRESIAIAHWLLGSGLALAVQGRRVLSVATVQNEAGSGERAAWHPLFFRVPLIQPDSLVRAVLPWTGWIHSRLMLLTWCLTVLIASLQVAGQWPRFSASSVGILAADNWLWLLGTVLILKLVHEFSHAVACRRYGGRVGAAGVMMVFFAPLAWIDVTSSWRFPSRWQRIHVALAGIYLESGIAAIAALWWCRTEPGVLSSHLYNIVLVGGVSSLIFNANPLMRADGYYVLSDLADIPNLMSSSMQQLLGTVRRLLLGTPPPLLMYTGWRRMLIRAYGPASCCWRLFVYTCLILSASVLLHGAGAVLAAVGIAVLLVRPLKRVTADLAGGLRTGRVQIRRLLLVGATGVFCVLIPAFGVGWQQRCSAPGVVQFAPHSVVRARAAGFLTEVRVELNQQVQQGDILAVLDSEELETEVRRLRFDVEASQLKCRLLQRQNRIAEYRIELDHLTGLQKQLQEKEDQVSSLVILAPLAGTVTGRNLRTLVGAYFEEGDELLSISGKTGREMRVSVSQMDAESFADVKGRTVSVRIPGRLARNGRLTQMTPRGTKQLDLLHLSAGFGGPVPVRATDSAASSGLQTHELLTPRFSATVEIAGPATELRAGETGAVSWLGSSKSAGERLISGIRRWISVRTGRNDHSGG
ncbi:MAG: biotin/lipoyl-binding protein [Planctomycetaceae bacterium]|nr:biotin/lipoyl-binding protein [Planctomycetaceae bacterium]